MKQIFTGVSVDEAKAAAAAAFGVSESEITFNVLEEPKKGLFGKIKGEAKVEAEYTAPAPAPAPVIEQPAAPVVEEAASAAETETNIPAPSADEAPAPADDPADRELTEAEQKKTNAAVQYIKDILANMGIENISVEASPAESGINIEISGDGFEELIGKKGDLLDALQYLSSLVCNKIDREYFRITTDCSGFRARRKAQLERLAHKLANNVKRSGRTHSLEPMNPYERRIIHASISEIEGVTSKSVGDEPYRKVVISSTEKRPYNNRGRSGRRGNGGRSGGNRRRPQPHYDITTSFEKDYKKPKPEDDMDLGSGVYGKLEF